MATLEESLKLFYLGEKNGEIYQYKNKDLTTHAAIIGMTGSGKTGLGITLLEEACLDNIPTIIIDPKGDMANLLLAFENFLPQDFLPYIDANEASSRGQSVDEMAQSVATEWKNGVENSHQSGERVAKFKQSVDFNLYTPQSSMGLSVSLLSDFIAPKGLNDEELNSYVLSLAESVLSLAGVDSEEANSPQVVLLQNIFLHNFLAAKNLTLPNLIEQIVTPKFVKIGIFDVDRFFPQDKRVALAMKINALIASPSFAKWCEGERLDIAKMLFNSDGKARCNIFSIAHLNDNQRMFFVTLLLNEIIAWMRTTQGTSSLRAVLYMDEIFGFFPPTSNPPSKTPMLTLLKQARAFGLGCVLSTQNPVDLDYKGLSNIGTWFIGRLQTAGDKERVISGLVGVGGENLDKNALKEIISNLKKRNFLVKNINEEGLYTLTSRFAMSYLKGPLSSEQISNLMALKKSKQPLSSVSKNLNETSQKPVLPSEISQIYCYGETKNLRPYLYGSASVRFSKKDESYIKEYVCLLDIGGVNEAKWSECVQNGVLNVQEIAKEGSSYGEIPRFVSVAKNLNKECKDFVEFLYQNARIKLYSALNLNSKFNESKEEFFIRLQDSCNEILEIETQKIISKFDKETLRLKERLKRAQIKLEKEKADVTTSGINAAISIGAGILGAIFGQKRAVGTKVATSVRSASRVLNEKDDVKYAQDEIDDINAQIDGILASLEGEISAIKDRYDVKNLTVESVEISPKKTDIFGEKVQLLWKS